jgi:hypothetical protein
MTRGTPDFLTNRRQKSGLPRFEFPQWGGTLRFKPGHCWKEAGRKKVRALSLMATLKLPYSHGTRGGKGWFGFEPPLPQRAAPANLLQKQAEQAL